MFLNHFVMEKQTKLVDNMKINGLKMSNYWIVNGAFNFGMYLAMVSIFYLMGKYVYVLDFFVETHFFLVALMLVTWGLN